MDNASHVSMSCMLYLVSCVTGTVTVVLCLVHGSAHGIKTLYIFPSVASTLFTTNSTELWGGIVSRLVLLYTSSTVSRVSHLRLHLNNSLLP